MALFHKHGANTFDSVDDDELSYRNSQHEAEVPLLSGHRSCREKMQPRTLVEPNSPLGESSPRAANKWGYAVSPEPPPAYAPSVFQQPTDCSSTNNSLVATDTRLTPKTQSANNKPINTDPNMPNDPGDQEAQNTPISVQ